MKHNCKTRATENFICRALDEGCGEGGNSGEGGEGGDGGECGDEDN